jgi:hypothetical protein
MLQCIYNYGVCRRIALFRPDDDSRLPTLADTAEFFDRVLESELNALRKKHRVACMRTL